MGEQLGVVIVAAGKGTRMQTAESKQYLLLRQKPILVHTLEAFQGMEAIQTIVLVVGADDVLRCQQYAKRYELTKLHAVIAGGAERQHSVYKGLQLLDTEWVLIHDGVRPFLTEEKVMFCWQAARKTGAAILAVPLKDTIKVANSLGQVERTLDRNSLWAVQTPQAFRLSAIKAAHEQAITAGFIATDDAALMEHIGETVQIVEGDYNNIKITTPDDWLQAEKIMDALRVDGEETETEDGYGRGEGKDENMIRIGHGFDVHQLVEGRKCIVGGVDIPFEKGLLGHSDGDVLLHAISDAILGALGAGDIGRHFPDTDPQYKDADSLRLLQHVWQLSKEKGYILGNLDATIMAQRPKMAGYIPDMVQCIATALDAQTSQVNVKATTTEQLGFVGREEGIAAQAVVCLTKQ